MTKKVKGVSEYKNKQGNTRYSAYYKNKSFNVNKSKTFKTHEEALSQRKAWEEEYGMPVWGGTAEDITGKRWGRLVAIKQVDTRSANGGAIWLMQCDCGNQIKSRPDVLKKGRLKSCGCLFEETIADTATKGRQILKENRVEGVELPRFTDVPYSHGTTGYRGVSETRHGNFSASIQVKGNVYTMGGFKTARDAYYNGRRVLEDKHLPKVDD